VNAYSICQSPQNTAGAAFNVNAANSGKGGIPAGISDIIKARVTAVAGGRTAVQAEGFAFEADSSSVRGGVGEDVYFKVVSNSGSGATLKQVFPGESGGSFSAQTEKQAAAAATRNLFKQAGMIKEAGGADARYKAREREEELKAGAALSKIKRDVLYGAKNIDQNAVRQLLASGISLDKIDFSMLTAALAELAPAKPGARAAEVARRLEQAANSDERTIARVISSGAPITLDSIYLAAHQTRQSRAGDGEGDRVGGAAGRFDSRPSDLKPAAILDDISLANAQNVSDGDFDVLKPQILRIFKQNGLDGGAHIKAAKLLFDNGLPVTADNVLKASFLQNGLSRIDPAELAGMGGDIGSIPLFEAYSGAGRDGGARPDALFDKYSEIIGNMPEFEAAAEGFLRTGQILTLQNLNLYVKSAANAGAIDSFAASRVYMKSAADTNPESPDAGAPGVQGGARQYVPALSDFKTQLADMRLRLTAEAAARLAASNTDITELPINQALTELRALAGKQYSANLRIMGAEDSAANAGRMNAVFEKLDAVRAAMRSGSASRAAAIIGAAVKTPTINAMAAAALPDQDADAPARTALNFTRALGSYQANATAVSARRGDRLADIADQFADLLRALGIEPAPANLRAAVILSKNGMDVNADNILAVKTLDMKIGDVLDRLHPNIAASMIRDGLDTLNMNIDDVRAYIDKFGGKYGSNLTDKLSQHILELDESGSISDEVRESMMAVYRLFSAIQKNGGAGIGAGVKSGASPTLGNLLSAARYADGRASGGKSDGYSLDYSVDKDFGALEALSAQNGIRGALERTARNGAAGADVSAGAADKAYGALLINDLINNANPGALSRVMDRATDRAGSLDPEQLSLEALNDALRQLNASPQEDFDEASARRVEMYTEQLRQMFSTRAGAIAWLNQNGVPATAGNVAALKKLMKDPAAPARALNDLADGDDGEIIAEIINTSGALDGTELKSLESGGARVLRALADKLNEMKARQTTYAGFERVSAAAGLMELRAATAGGLEAHIPVKLKNGLSVLSVYVVNRDFETAESSTLVMSLSTRGLGDVQARITRTKAEDGDRISLNFSAESPEALAALKARVPALEGGIEGSGFVAGDITFTLKADGDVPAGARRGKPYAETGSYTIAV